ncbi:hypothetical protein QQZ08_006325 [Neonectria magnoliae]|uniref:Peptidase A1 domain-containing protein n=1 Tax=Neonectria magnoliae TaxID=2732573 RepID=A0ABR1I180_9HYPO
MKFSVLLFAVVQLGRVSASPNYHDEPSTHQLVEGYWEEDAPPSHYPRSNAPGKKFHIKEVQNEDYHGLGVTVEMARAFGKYQKPPPPPVTKALKARVSPSSKKIKTNKKVGSVASYPTEYYDSQYVVPVQIGTPPQLTYLNLDTGSADLWTFSMDTDQPDAVGHILYAPGKSITCKLLQGLNWSLQYGDGSGASGIVYQDKVQVGGTAVNLQTVQSAVDVSDAIAEDTFSSGIMGMAFSTINSVRPNRQQTYLENIQSTLAQPIMTANLKKGLPGTYNFGYIDKSEYTGSVYFQPIWGNSPFWQITLSGFSVGKNSFQKYNWPAIVDTGTTLLLAPQKIVNYYYARVKGAALDPDWGVMTFPCASKLPDFFFGLGPYRGRVPGFYMNYGPIGGGFCYGGLQTSDGIGFAILGDILLKAQFVVFDIQARTLGFANKATVAPPPGGR